MLGSSNVFDLLDTFKTVLSRERIIDTDSVFVTLDKMVRISDRYDSSKRLQEILTIHKGLN
jgi:hypothetical protein